MELVDTLEHLGIQVLVYQVTQELLDIVVLVAIVESQVIVVFRVIREHQVIVDIVDIVDLE